MSTLELRRSSTWGLEVLGLGKASRSTPVPRSRARPGELVEPVTLNGADASGSFRVELREVYINDVHSVDGGPLTVTMSAQAGRIEFGSTVEGSGTCFVWCLNGPRDISPLHYTEREQVDRYVRRRPGEADRVFEANEHDGFTLDFLCLPGFGGPCKQVALNWIDEKVAPSQIRPMSLEFQLADSATTPTWDDIDLYIAAISFVLGRQLIPVGFTIFDASVNPRVHEVRAAWSPNLESELQHASVSPVPLGGAPSPAKESAIGTLVMALQREADTFGLVDALSRLRLAKVGVMEAAIPNLAAALEGIMSTWFKSSKTKSKGKYLDDAAWSAALDAPLAALNTNLRAHSSAERIIRRVKAANHFGVNERFEQFFAELGLRVGDVEQDAIRARNKAAHGGTYERSAYRQLLNRTNAYRTLLHRTILKIIGWTGEYTDYSTYGYPVRPLDAPLGGPEGGGKAE